MTDTELLDAIALAQSLAWVSTIHRDRLEYLTDMARARGIKLEEFTP